MSVPRTILIEMIRPSLELAFDHVQNGLDDLALRELDSAREKILQLKEVKVAEQPLLTLTTNDHFPHDTGTHPEIHD